MRSISTPTAFFTCEAGVSRTNTCRERRRKRRSARLFMPSRLLGSIVARPETALAAVIIVAGAIFSLSTPYFLTLSNAVDLVDAYAVTTILAAGVFVVLVSGGIDISFAATASVAQYAAAYVATAHGLPPAPTI